MLRLGRSSAGRSDHDGLHVADVAVPHQLRREAVVVAGPLLRAELEDDAVLLHGFAQRQSFGQRHAQRLLAVHVLPAPGSLDPDQRMPSFSGRDDHRVDVGPRQQLPEIRYSAPQLESPYRLIDRGLGPFEVSPDGHRRWPGIRTSGILRNPRTWPHPMLPTPIEASVMRSLGGDRLGPGDDVPGHDHRSHGRGRCGHVRTRDGSPANALSTTAGPRPREWRLLSSQAGG